jgi:hypothetical protein
MSTETAKRNPFAVHLLHQQPQASGFVTHDSVEDLLFWIERLLFTNGDLRDPRPYTMVYFCQYAGWRPQAKACLEARRVELLQDDRGCAIGVHDTDGFWTLSGNLPTQPRSGDGDVLRESMYLFVSDRCLLVQLRTPEGLLAWRCIQVEEKGYRI